MKSNISLEIIKAIKDALIAVRPDVQYNKPTSDGQCGFFKVTTNGNLSLDEIDECLKSVVDEYSLDRDPHFDGTFDLNAYWDNK